ncbi:MAG: DUF2892 domain-containing protein [Rhodobacteraceae bacterium]|nr:DUF2892 domain-containing protein [Paracoccaceae bacterium]
MNFNANIGSLDRALRILFGITLFVISYLGYLGGYGWVGVLIGGVLMTTAVFSFCPLYGILKLKTTPKE